MLYSISIDYMKANGSFSIDFDCVEVVPILNAAEGVVETILKFLNRVHLASQDRCGSVS